MATLQPIDTRAIFAQSLLSGGQGGGNNPWQGATSAFNKAIGAMLLKKASVRRQEKIDEEKANVTQAFKFIEDKDFEGLAGIAGDLPVGMRGDIAKILTAKGPTTTRPGTALEAKELGLVEGTSFTVDVHPNGSITDINVIQRPGDVPETWSQMPEEQISADLGLTGMPSNRIVMKSSRGNIRFDEAFPITDEFELLGADEVAEMNLKVPPGHQAMINRKDNNVKFIGTTPPQGFRRATVEESTAAGFPDVDAGYVVYINKVTGLPSTFRKIALQPDEAEKPIDPIYAEYGKKEGARLSAMQGKVDDEAFTAIDASPKLDAFEAALEGFETGTLGNARAGVGRLLNLFGVDQTHAAYGFLKSGSPANADLMRAMRARLVVDLASSDVFEGNLNKQEIEIFSNSVVGL